MKRYTMVSFLVVGAIFSANNVAASALSKTAYLKISLGQVPGECSESNEVLLQKAQFDAVRLLGKDTSSMERISNWNQNVYEKWYPFSDECQSKEAWAEAAFVNQNEIDHRWILMVSGSYSQYSDENISDDEAFEKALDKARQRAALFCKGQLLKEPVSVYEKVKKIFGSYTLFSLSAQFECFH